MLIIMHTPQFTHEDVVHGTLMGRHTVTLSCNSGVITLDQADCRAMRAAVINLAEREDDDLS